MKKWGKGIVEQLSLDLQNEFPAIFVFVSLPVGYDEEELEDALEQNITRILLELGSGFAFIGRQKEIIVAGKTRRC